MSEPKQSCINRLRSDPGCHNMIEKMQWDQLGMLVNLKVSFEAFTPFERSLGSMLT